MSNCEKKHLHKISIIIQLFVKIDYLQDIITKLLKLNIKNYNVIFWQDSLVNSKFYNKNIFLEKYNECKNIIDKNLHLFKNSEFKQNDTNLGTCKTCEVSINYAFSKSEYVIFLEDDVIPSKKFLKFFEYFIENNMINFDNKNLFIAPESIFFDSRKEIPTKEHIKICNKIVNEKKYNKYYIKVKFVPSSCFCTNYKIWEKIGHIRGSPLGDEDLCKYINDNNYFTIMPVIACCKDVGMLNKNGYSVIIHGNNNITEVKNTYIINDDDDDNNENKYELYPFNKDFLFRVSVNLENNYDLLNIL